MDNLQPTQEEVWKHIKDLPLGYEVSSLGNLRINYGNNKFKSIDIKSSADGYQLVNLFGKTLKIHHIVATAFIPNPENKPIVNHIDHVKTNNVVSNLEWVTYRENALHEWKTVRSRGRSVMCVESQQIYSTMSSAAVHVGLPITCVRNSADNDVACCGLHFKYVDICEGQEGVMYIPETELATISEQVSSIEEFYAALEEFRR